MRSSEWRDVALLRGIVLFVVAVILTVAVAVGVSLGRRARNPDQGAKYLITQNLELGDTVPREGHPPAPSDDRHGSAVEIPVRPNEDRRQLRR